MSPSRFFYELQKLSQLLLVKRSSLLLVSLLEQVDKPDMICGHEAVELQDKRHGPGRLRNKRFVVAAGERVKGGVLTFSRFIRRGRRKLNRSHHSFRRKVSAAPDVMEPVL